MTDFLTKIVKLVSVACAIFVLFGALGRHHWFLDLFSHFRIQYTVVLAILGVLLFFTKARLLASVVVLITVLLTISLWPYYVFEASEKNGQEFKVISYNLNTSNNQFERVKDFIRKEEADIVFLMEVNNIWAFELKGLEERYPFSFYHPRDDNFGFVLFSKYPLADRNVDYFGEARVPSVVTKVNLEGVSIDFIGTHPMPPIGAELSGRRNEHIQGLQKYIVSEAPEYLLVTGDFNATPWSFIMHDFFDATKIYDSRYGRGIRGTWFRQLFFVTIPIDYILGSRNVLFHSLKLGDPMGSDHSPLIATFSLQRAKQPE